MNASQILKAITGLVFVILSAASIANEQWVPLTYRADNDTYVVDVEVEGKRAKAAISLSAPMTSLSERFFKSHTFSGDLPKIEILGEGSSYTKSLQVFVNPLLEQLDIDVLLSFDYFADKVLYWDIANKRIRVSDKPTATKNQYKFSDQLEFKWKDRKLTLPMFSSATKTGTEKPPGPAFVFGNPEENVEKLLTNNMSFCLQDDLWENKLFFDVPEGRDAEIPGASFFGDQVVEINFKESYIAFERTPQAIFLYALSQRLVLDLELKNGDVHIVGHKDPEMNKKLEEAKVLGERIYTIGDKLLSADSMVSSEFRPFLQQLKKKKYVYIIRKDGSFMKVPYSGEI